MSLCATLFGRTEPHATNVPVQQEPAFFNSTRKVAGVAGALFFTLGAVVMDPILLIPAGICVIIACGWGCLDLLSTICSAFADTRRPATATPLRNVVVLQAPTPVYYGAPQPHSTHGGYVSMANVRQSFAPPVAAAAPPPTAAAHVVRGGGYAVVQQPQPAPQTHVTLADVGLSRATAAAVALPPTAAAHVARGGGYAVVQQPQPAPQTRFTLADVGLSRDPSVAPPPALTANVRRGGGATMTLPPQSPVPSPSPAPRAQGSAAAVAPQPVLRVQRGGGFTTG